MSQNAAQNEKKKPKILLDLVDLFSFFTFSQQHALFIYLFFIYLFEEDNAN